MAKINEVRRIVVEDFKSEDRDVANKLAFVLNPFFNSIVTALNNSLTIQDNLNAELREITFVTSNDYVETGSGGGGDGPIPVEADVPTGGGNDKVFYLNDNTVTTDYTLPAGKNAMSAGPITVDVGVTVTVPVGANWVVV